MVNEPALSVEPLATVADGVVAQAVGVPIVGLLVWVILKCASESTRVAKVVVVPLTVMLIPLVSAVNRLVGVVL